MGFLRSLISFVLIRIIGYLIMSALVIGGFIIFYKIIMTKYGL